MARIENYGNDALVTINDKVIGTDAADNSTKNFRVGDIVALATAGTALTAGAGISITNGVISSTIVDTDTNNYISNVALNGTSLDFTGTAPAFNGSVALGAIADQTVVLTGTGGVAITGTYPNFTIDGSGIAGGGGVTGTGTTNNVPKWTGTSTLGSSLIIDDGNGVAVGVQPPAARFHVHNGGASNSILKLTHSANTGVQDGMDITLSSIAGQIWLYEPNIPLRFATNNAERFSIDGAGQGWFKYGLRISAGIVDSNTTKGTAGQILSSTGSEVEWINAPSGASTLNALTDTTITTPSTGQYLVYNGSAWVNAEFKPAEKLILQIINGYTLASNQSADLLFTAVTGNLNTGGLHISQSNLADLGAAGAGFEVLNTDCKAKISIGAFIDATSNNEVLTFTLTERDPNGITALKGRAQFDYARAGTHASAFFSNFELLAGYTYLFSASLTNTSNGVTILQPTQIEIEIIG